MVAFDFTLDEIYGVIGAIIAAIIATLIKYRSKFSKDIGSQNQNQQSDSSVKDVINDKFDTQNKILDKGLENIVDGMERLEEKVNYINKNVEDKLIALRKDLDKLDGKVEKVQDRLNEHVRSFINHVDNHEK